MSILAVSITFWFLFAIVFVLLYLIRKQKDFVVKKGVEVSAHKDQREYWFSKHNQLRERVLMVASEVKDIEIAFNKKMIGTHTACNKLTAIIAKMANDEFRDQYIFSVTEMKEKHEQEAKQQAAQRKLDVARKKAHKIDVNTQKIIDSKSSSPENKSDQPPHNRDNTP